MPVQVGGTGKAARRRGLEPLPSPSWKAQLTDEDAEVRGEAVGSKQVSPPTTHPVMDAQLMGFEGETRDHGGQPEPRLQGLGHHPDSCPTPHGAERGGTQRGRGRVGWVSDLRAPDQGPAPPHRSPPAGRGLGAPDQGSETTWGSWNRGRPGSARTRRPGAWGQLPPEFPAPGGALAQASWFPCHRGAPRGLATRRANSRSAGFVAPSRPEPVSAAGTDPGNWRGRPGRAKWGLEAESGGQGSPRARVTVEAPSGAGSGRRGGLAASAGVGAAGGSVKRGPGGALQPALLYRLPSVRATVFPASS